MPPTPADAQSPVVADTLLVNGFVVTLDPSRPRAEAFAIRDGRVVAVGSTAELSGWAGRDTETIDAQGRMVMPGLVDGHCHPTKGAIAQLFSCRFAFDATPDTIAAAVRASLASSPDAQVILGGRWGSGFFERYPLTSPRGWLDALAPTRPVYLRDDSGHNGWANSAALRLVGFDRDTPDPKGGRILRDATGEPDGRLLEEADSLARNRLPDWSAAQYRAGVREMARMANAYGIIGVNDADASESLLKAYHEVDQAGELSVYVAASISTPYGHRDTPLDIATYEALRDRYASPRVDTRFVKIYEDGVPTSARSAAMLEPYLPHPEFEADFRGMLHVDEDTLTADIAAFEARGFTVKLHTAGDRAVRVALNAIERAHRRSGRSDLRHELAHAGFVAREDLPRFRALNVVADLSPYLWFPSPIIDSIVGAIGPRGRDYWPIRDMLAGGTAVLAGSDWPAAVASMNPWPGLAALVTRRDPAGRSTEALWPEQAIGLDEALGIFTLAGARALRRDAQTGSIEIGKSGDFIVLNQNLFAIDPSAIATTEVLATYLAGQCVHVA